MAGQDNAGSIQACAMRLARLDSTGATPAGASNMYVTDNMVTLAVEPEIEVGEDIKLKTACGKLAVDWRDPDRARRLKLTLTMAIPEPEQLELMAGALLVTTAANTDGFAFPTLGTIGNLDGVSMELWSKAILNGALAATNPYWRWVLPKTYGWTFGGITFLNGVEQIVLTGWGVENALFGNGPNNDWPAGAPTRALNVKRAAALPAITTGYIATPAQV